MTVPPTDKPSTYCSPKAMQQGAMQLNHKMHLCTLLQTQIGICSMMNDALLQRACPLLPVPSEASTLCPCITIANASRTAASHDQCIAMLPAGGTCSNDVQTCGPLGPSSINEQAPAAAAAEPPVANALFPQPLPWRRKLIKSTLKLKCCANNCAAFAASSTTQLQPAASPR
jgi:hypothetical protein